MDLTGTKAIVLVLLGIIKLFFGLAPLVFTKILKKRSDRFLKKFIGIVLCFGGGVLLSTVFLHMLREVRESVERSISMGMFGDKEIEYPLAELWVGLGFLLILLIESCVHKFFGGHGHSHFPSQETLAKKFVTVEDSKDDSSYDVKDDSSDEGIENNAYDCNACCSPSPTHSHAANVYTVSGTSTSSSDTESDSSNNNTKSQRRDKMLKNIRSFLVVIALSVHSLFEGMAIGLEESDSGVWKLLMAVSIHAAPIVFCVGTDMISSGVKKIKIIIYMIVLSINTPIGILIGIIVTIHTEHASPTHVFIIGLLQGLAAGTLLYITFFEVLCRDKLSKYGMSGLLGAVAVILGFTLMAGMEAAGPEHSHGGGGHHGGHHHGVGHHGGHGAEKHSDRHVGHSHEDHHDADHVLHFLEEQGHHDEHEEENEDHHQEHKKHEIHTEDHHRQHNEQHDDDHEEHHDEHDEDEDEHHDEDIGEHHEEEHDEDESVTHLSEDYFQLNISDYQFMHDNVAY